MATVEYEKEARHRGFFDLQIESFTKFLPEGAYIAGGYVAASINGGGAKASDIDFFFHDAEAYEKTYDLLVNPPKDEAAWAFQGYTTEITKESLYTEKLKLVTFTGPGKLPIQLIKMVWYDGPAHVIDSFDFTVAQFCIDQKWLIFNPLAMHDLVRNRIVLHRQQYPADMLYRLVKYTKKGFDVSPLSLIQLAEAIRDTAQSDPPMLTRMY